MLGRQTSHLPIVGEHAVARDRRVIVPVHHHQRHAALHHRRQVILVVRGARATTRPSHAPLGQRLQLGSFLLGILARRAQQQPVALRRDHGVHCREDPDEERVHEIRNDDADGGRAAEREAPRDGVWTVAVIGDVGKRTRARVTSPMSGALFSTFETVVTDTPSSAAICFMVGAASSLPWSVGQRVPEPHGQPGLRRRPGAGIGLQAPASRGSSAKVTSSVLTCSRCATSSGTVSLVASTPQGARPTARDEHDNRRSRGSRPRRSRPAFSAGVPRRTCETTRRPASLRSVLVAHGGAPSQGRRGCGAPVRTRSPSHESDE